MTLVKNLPFVQARTTISQVDARVKQPVSLLKFGFAFRECILLKVIPFLNSVVALPHVMKYGGIPEHRLTVYAT